MEDRLARGVPDAVTHDMFCWWLVGDGRIWRKSKNNLIKDIHYIYTHGIMDIVGGWYICWSATWIGYPGYPQKKRYTNWTILGFSPLDWSCFCWFCCLVNSNGLGVNLSIVKCWEDHGSDWGFELYCVQKLSEAAPHWRGMKDESLDYGTVPQDHARQHGCHIVI